MRSSTLGVAATPGNAVGIEVKCKDSNHKGCRLRRNFAMHGGQENVERTAGLLLITCTGMISLYILIWLGIQLFVHAGDENSMGNREMWFYQKRKLT